MTNENGQPPAKRARTTRTPAPHEYAPCPCYDCQGALQLPRTIRDHRLRYPWPEPEQPTSPAHSPPNGQDPLSDPITPPHSPQYPYPTPDQYFSPPRHPSPPVRHPSEPPLDDDLLRTPSPGARRQARRHISPEDLPGINPNDRHEHRFDELLPRQAFPDLDVDEELLGLEEDDEPEEDEIFDEYGLPHNYNEPPGEEHQPFEPPWANQAGDDPDPNPNEEIDPAEYCAAFREHPLIRNAYTDAIVQKILFGASHSALNHQLKAARRQLYSNPDIPAEDLARMAVTIRTVERRLGLDPTDIITIYTLCPLCGRSYHPNYITQTDSAACQNDDCDGILYDVQELASGKQQRVSRLTFPYASIIAWLRRLLVQPGMSELVQNWRTEDDQEIAEPKPPEEWLAGLNMDTPIGDISEGSGWRSRATQLERVVDEQTGDVEDQSLVDPPVGLSSIPLGLSLTLSTDWFRATREGNYSVGAGYMALNNLPRHLRFLRENMCLVLVTPGPKEPTDYALDQMLAPLIEELLRLGRGVEMSVRRGEDAPVYEDQVVYAELSQHIADLIARIKVGGCAGLKSELNFCLYCRARLSSLSVPAGYIRQELPYRNTDEDLTNTYYWRSLENPQERRAFFEFTGNRFTALHRLPGWHTSTCSPLDAMHLLYLGVMNWIFTKILFQPGMLDKRLPTDDDPVERFNACLDRMWLPGNFSRRPPKLGQTNTRIKADQWKLATRVAFIPLYMAFRHGDTIPHGFIPRGNKSSRGAKNQASRAQALHRERRKYYTSIGQPAECPPLASCFPSRNLQLHYKQVLRFCVATSALDKRTVTPNEILFGTELLEAMCIDYVENNVPTPPNFHMLMHLGDTMLKYGSLYNTHVWGMERTNGILSGTSHNGRGKGVLEGTLMRAWWGIVNLQILIKYFRSLHNRTPSDDAVLENLLSALRGGPEHAAQRGALAAYIAQTRTAYTRLHGIQEPIRLSKQSLALNFHGHMLASLEMAWRRANSTFLPGVSSEDTAMLSMMVFVTGPSTTQVAEDTAMVMDINLGTASWEFNELDVLETVAVDSLSGTFALFEVPTSQADYWVTVSLDTLSPERDDKDDDDDDIDDDGNGDEDE